MDITRAETIQILKRTPMFKDLDDAALSELAGKIVPRGLEKDEILLLAGERSSGLFVVAKGALRASRVNGDGREQVIHVERAPATIAEIPVFDDGVYPSTVAAEENSIVFFISKENVKSLFLKYPQLALSALKLMAGRLRRTAFLIEEISLHEVRQRLARYLLEEARRQNFAGVKLELRLTNREIAARIGSVREVVSRALQRLQQENLIEIENRRISILNADALSRLAQE